MINGKWKNLNRIKQNVKSKVNIIYARFQERNKIC